MNSATEARVDKTIAALNAAVEAHAGKPTKAEQSAAKVVAELFKQHRIVEPPLEAIALLTKTAKTSTSGGKAARCFLFWLVGQPDPVFGDYREGATEMRLMDTAHKEAVFHVFQWWTGCTQSDQPLYTALEEIEAFWKPILPT